MSKDVRFVVIFEAKSILQAKKFGKHWLRVLETRLSPSSLGYNHA